MAGSATAVLPATSAAADPAAQAALVVWGACAPSDIANVPPAEQSKFGCANYVVPLDYNRPNRGTINLALMRRTANDQANRIGSLFLNPGGPSGSGYRLPTIGQLIFQAAVLDRFDLIGFDPRGVRRSTPLRCFLTQEDADSVNSRIALLPITRAQERSRAIILDGNVDPNLRLHDGLEYDRQRTLGCGCPAPARCATRTPNRSRSPPPETPPTDRDQTSRLRTMSVSALNPATPSTA